MRYSIDERTGEIVGIWLSNAWFNDRCATHDGTGIGPNNENYPTAHKWNCVGCRWNPNENKS